MISSIALLIQTQPGKNANRGDNVSNNPDPLSSCNIKQVNPTDMPDIPTINNAFTKNFIANLQ